MRLPLRGRQAGADAAAAAVLAIHAAATPPSMSAEPAPRTWRCPCGFENIDTLAACDLCDRPAAPGIRRVVPSAPKTPRPPQALAAEIGRGLDRLTELLHEAAAASGGALAAAGTDQSSRHERKRPRLTPPPAQTAAALAADDDDDDDPAPTQHGVAPAAAPSAALVVARAGGGESAVRRRRLEGKACPPASRRQRCASLG